MKQKVTMRIGLLCLALLLLPAMRVVGQEKEYTNGVFLLNEDYFGGSNGSINYLDFSENPPTWIYRAFRKENPGKEFGCTSQHGIIYGDRLYVVSKQEKDGGASITGGRLVIANAKTLKEMLTTQTFMVNADGKSMADGRACVGVTERTTWIGSSNGIFLSDTNYPGWYEQIEETKNPLVSGEENPSQGQGALYNNQIGNMIRGSMYVFAVQQDRGVLVLDPEYGKILRVIEGCFSAMVMTPDGMVNVVRNTNAAAQKYPYGNFGDAWTGTRLVRINQHTLDTVGVEIPKEFQMPQTWYAWTNGGVCASKKKNVIYWKKAPAMMFGGTSTVIKLDLDATNPTPEEFYTIPDNGHSIYGAAIEVDPQDRYLYLGVNVGSFSNEFYVARVDLSDKSVSKFPLEIKHYWFPAMFIFPDNAKPTIKEGKLPSEISFTTDEGEYVLDLSDAVTDDDNLDCAIVKDWGEYNGSLIAIHMEGDKMHIRSTWGESGTSPLELRFNSNGHQVVHNMNVTVTNPTPIQSLTVEPTEALLYVGDSLQLKWTPEPNTAINRIVDWTSPNAWTASVSRSGLVEARSPGTVTIKGRSFQNSSITALCIVTVSAKLEEIKLSESTLSLKKGDSHTITASPVPASVANFSVTWESSAPDIVSISPDGLSVTIKAERDGKATLTARSALSGGITSECVVNVDLPLVEVANVAITTPSNEGIYIGSELQLAAEVTPSDATNPAIEWSSSEPTFATVSSSGLVTALAMGETVITATSVQNPTAKDTYTLRVLTPVESLALTPSQALLNRGASMQLTATIAPTTASNQEITWESSAPDVVEVTASGLITARKAGEATITAVSVQNPAVKASCSVAVQVAVESLALQPSSTLIKVGQTQQLTPIVEPKDATNQLIAWSSGNKNIATVSGEGLVTGVGEGETSITALISGGKTAHCVVTVRKDENKPDPTPSTPTAVDALSGAEISLYPNPTSGLLHVEGIGNAMAVTLVNAQGVEVFRGIATPHEPISVGHLPKGIYLVKLENGVSLRLVIE